MDKAEATETLGLDQAPWSLWDQSNWGPDFSSSAMAPILCSEIRMIRRPHS